MPTRTKRPYCGGKSPPPHGRSMATSPTQCKGQVRAYGKRVRFDPVVAVMGRELLQRTGGCGIRSKTSERVQEDCARQVRLYGLLPAVQDARDLRRRTFFADAPETYAALPRVRLTHPYTHAVHANANAHSRGGDLVFVSVGSERVEDDAWAHAPTDEVGGVGFAFGYFPRGQRGTKARSFHIVHVHVNPPYRKGAARASTVSSWVVEQLVASVVARARRLYGADVALTLEVDPNAPCFQLGNPQYMTEQRSQALEDMYVGAGFDVVPLPHEGRRRRTVRFRTTT